MNNFISFYDYTFIYMWVCVFVVDTFHGLKEVLPLSFHVNLSCQVSLGQGYIF